jgi:hypothetical protein
VCVLLSVRFLSSLLFFFTLFVFILHFYENTVCSYAACHIGNNEALRWKEHLSVFEYVYMTQVCRVRAVL